MAPVIVVEFPPRYPLSWGAAYRLAVQTNVATLSNAFLPRSGIWARTGYLPSQPGGPWPGVIRSVLCSHCFFASMVRRAWAIFLMIDRAHRFLLIGIFLLVLAAVFTLSGETLERYHGIVRRAKEPKRFWWDVVMYFIAGLFFIGLYLYQSSH